MNKLSVTKKVLSFVCCAALSTGIIAAYPIVTDHGQMASAKTIAEIEEQKKANSAKIAELEEQINSLEGDKDNEKAQQEYLNEQINCIQENINLLNAELESINNDIETTQTNITNLDTDINNQQDEIDNNIELFKQRLCAMYMNSNETSASVVLGSSSFYDMMSRVQMINRIAEYDDELINSILDDIDRLEQSKSDLETERLSLQMKQEEQEKRKAEKADELMSLNEKIKLTQAEIDRIAKHQEDLARSKEEIEADNAVLEEEERKIQEEIKRQQEEAQRRYEEQLRQQQQAALQQQQQQASSGSTTISYDGPSVIDVSPSTSGYCWPVPGHSGISSYYGSRSIDWHKGIDISDGGIMGAPVVASKSGIVVSCDNRCTHNWGKSYGCGCGGNYGNYVTLSHDGTYSTLYGHMTTITVSAGQYVEQGEVIGYVGTTGWSTGAHLHFEVRVNGSCVDPMGFVSP